MDNTRVLDFAIIRDRFGKIDTVEGLAQYRKMLLEEFGATKRQVQIIDEIYERAFFRIHHQKELPKRMKNG